MNTTDRVRLVVQYDSGDGCTFSCTNTHPIMAESAEAVAVEFEAAAKKAFADGEHEFTMYGVDFDTMSFFVGAHVGGSLSIAKRTYSPPSIFTLDEWFNTNSDNW